MTADRAAIFVALRGARCAFHATTEMGLARLDDDRDDCADCDEARADAVLAAIQPTDHLLATIQDIEAGNVPQVPDDLRAMARAVVAGLPCGHPLACATTPDSPPHGGSTWTCAWCGEVMRLRADAAYIQKAVDQVCHYRNLAIVLGARPDQMLSSEDRALCEAGTADWPTTDFSQREAWEEVDAARAEVAALREALAAALAQAQASERPG